MYLIGQHKINKMVSILLILVSIILGWSVKKICGQYFMVTIKWSVYKSFGH